MEENYFSEPTPTSTTAPTAMCNKITNTHLWLNTTGEPLQEGALCTCGETTFGMPVTKDTRVSKALNDLYEVIKHGDDEHQKWLRDKIEEFIKNNNY